MAKVKVKDLEAQIVQDVSLIGEGKTDDEIATFYDERDRADPENFPKGYTLLIQEALQERNT